MIKLRIGQSVDTSATCTKPTYGMNYETAKQLKDAGFLQRPQGSFVSRYEGIDGKIYELLFQYVEGKETEGLIYAPTLEELIEACGDSVYLCCETVGGRRIYVAAQELKTNGDWVNSRAGDTPKIAVARLWLALNQK